MSSSFNVGWLKYGLTSKRHATRGWLKKLLVQQNLLVDGNDAIWMRVMRDYQCQLVAMEVMRSIQGSDYKDPRLVTEHGVFKGKENGRYKKKRLEFRQAYSRCPILSMRTMSPRRLSKGKEKN